MNKKFLIAIISVLTIIATRTHAQGVILVAQDTASYPEVLIQIPPASQDNVIMQDTVFTESVAPVEVPVTVPESATTNVTGKNNKISFYMQKLSLTPEQKIKAQEISNEGYAEQEELLKNIKEDLRKQAHEIEQSTFARFEAILTDEQKAEFYRLRNGEEAVVSQAEPQLTEAQAEPQPTEAQAEPQSAEAQAEPQPAEAQAEPQPAEAQAEPQPVEAQAEPQPVEAQAEPQPVEAQAEPQPAEAQQ